jgi:hypothetical protein
MTVTMNSMELKRVDTIKPNSLMEGDLIEVDGEIVEVISIESDSTQDFWAAIVKNDFDEEYDVILVDDKEYSWYVYVDDVDDLI